ncbi:hypothetical protein TcCL_Unassigned04287 [Trypanosoma cruzi]|nr:hypothetical protein TcCL_Unassigned04287 [Trypanosoma cruzi]
MNSCSTCCASASSVMVGPSAGAASKGNRAGVTLSRLENAVCHSKKLHATYQKRKRPMGKRKGWSHRREGEKAMRRAHPRPQREGRGASTSTALSFTSLPRRNSTAAHSRPWRVAPHTHKWSTAHTIRSPPSALSRPAPSRPRAIAMGNTNNRRRGPSAPLAGKKAEEMENVRSTISRGTHPTKQEETK